MPRFVIQIVALRQQIPITAQILVVHGLHRRLAGFGHALHRRAEQDRGAQSGIDVTVAEGLLQHLERGLAGTVDRRDPLDLPRLVQGRGDALYLLVLRREQMGAADDQVQIVSGGLPSK